MKDTYGETIFFFKGSAPFVALTIDDCPGHDADLFEKLLDVLRKHGARATLFITSNYANDDKMKKLLKRAVEEGHELGNHMPQDKPYH